MTVRGEQSPMDEAVALALRTLRQPRSGIAAVLAMAVRGSGASLVAAFSARPGAAPEMLASAGPGAPDLGPPGPVGARMAAVLEGFVRTPRRRDASFPDPWSRYPCLRHDIDRLPNGGVAVLLAAGEKALDDAVLARAMAPLDVLVSAVESQHRQDALERELLRSRQDQALLAAGVHHDLRTPLTSILGCARTLRDRIEELPADQREELLDIIVSQASRLTEMISESLSHHGADPSSPLRFRRVDPLELAERVAGAARSARGGDVALQVEESSFVCDERRLERALLNLVDNALKYGPPGAPVHLTGSRSGASYVFTVADAGPGVSAEVVSSMFTPFATDPDREDGTGLGLHTAATLMNELGGSVAYARQDGWTRFSLAVPLRAAGDQVRLAKVVGE